MSYHAKRRDLCERAIIDALRSYGCSVTQLDATGVPDLLVGFRGRTILLECKDEHGRAGRGMARSDDGLRDSQRKWWAEWKGAAPMVVTNPEEAIAAVMEKFQ